METVKLNDKNRLPWLPLATSAVWWLIIAILSHVSRSVDRRWGHPLMSQEGGYVQPPTGQCGYLGYFGRWRSPFPSFLKFPIRNHFQSIVSFSANTSVSAGPNVITVKKSPHLLNVYGFAWCVPFRFHYKVCMISVHWQMMKPRCEEIQQLPAFKQHSWNSKPSMPSRTFFKGILSVTPQVVIK